jgi:valyl-tRNA synthetase
MSATETIFSTQYEPQTTEAKWQKYWENNQIFQADPTQKGETFSIVIPPPNVTGSLHMGHAFNTALIDTLVRYHRMSGKNTLCLPGTDHASIAVQTLIEKQLKTEGKTRYDLGREKFLEQAWQWRQESGGRIINQLKRIGLSADWTRERFTLDPNLSLAVKTAFVKLYEEGLIYRGNYMVNWCPESHSAVSDLEVENQEVDGYMWHFRYPLTEGEGFVEVATTRPETMLGDTAVAVNPHDERYQDLIGKTVTLPIMGREIPIIADELVDPEFGTGCVKVTPAHDPNDFEMGKRHALPFINILHKDGTLNENAGDFAGQDRFVARENVVKRLEQGGFLVRVEDYRHSVPYSDRGKVPVEPLISTQWFIKIEPLAQKALEFLDRYNSPRFVPERWTKVYRDWLVKLKDWCISRQLWWGHQIPAWYVISETNGEITAETPFIVALNAEQAKEKALAKYGENVMLTQDPDVLDTWFSSGLWPFSTMGWPENTLDLQVYYPNSTMVTGFDIIFFWVARMTMMAGHFTERMPFKDVYIHGLVRDEQGKKMSKSANNGIDPLILIDQYGTDALRYTLIKEVAGAGQDISLKLNREMYLLKLAELELRKEWQNQSELAETLQNLAKTLQIQHQTLQNKSKPISQFLEKLAKAWQNQSESLEQASEKLLETIQNQLEALQDNSEPLSESVEASRNFANKLWNAARFVLLNLDGKTPAQLGYPDLKVLALSALSSPDPLMADRWILSRFNQVVKQTRDYIENYGLGEAAKGLYEFIWGDFCDWYIELVKSRLKQDAEPNSRLVARQTLAYVLEGILKLLHPFMPHITEEIWHSLTQTIDQSLALQRLPQVDELLDYNLSKTATLATVHQEQKSTIVQFSYQLKKLWSQLPKQVNVFSKKYRQPFLLLAVVLIVLIILQLLSSLSSAIYEFPLLSPTLKVIGLYYTLWFFYRNLFFAGSRQDLFKKIASIKQEIFSSQETEKILELTIEKPQETKPISPIIETLINPELEENFSLLFDTIRTIRHLRAEAEIKPGVKVPVILQTENEREQKILASTESYIEELAKVEELTITASLAAQQTQAIASVVGTIQVLIPLAGIIDVEALKTKLVKKLAKIEAEVKSLTDRLNNPGFVNKAPAHVVQNTKDDLKEAQTQLEILEKRLKLLS